MGKKLMPAGNNNNQNMSSQSLPPSVKHQFETEFGQDFSDVRVHEGHQPTLVGARAYTMGNDIYFAPGNYQPHDKNGAELIGHELTHVVQQRGGQVLDVPKGMVETEKNLTEGSK